MINRIVEKVLILSSISPVFLTLWIGEFIRTNNYESGLFYLILFILLIPISWGIIKLSKKKLEILQINVVSVAPADKEVAAFLIAYIFPMLTVSDIDYRIIFVIISLLYIAMLSTSNYHFNPIISLILRYHYYEIEVDNGTGGKFVYVLMTKQTIRNVKKIKEIIQISDYMLMEVNTK